MKCSEITYRPLSEMVLLESNPRTIKKADMDRLVAVSYTHLINMPNLSPLQGMSTQNYAPNTPKRGQRG